MVNSTAKAIHRSEVSVSPLISVAAMLFGAFLILGVGFAHSSTVHQVAHDSRHSNVFPCH